MVQIHSPRPFNPMSDELRRSIQQTAKVLRQFGAREVYTFGSAAEGA